MQKILSLAILISAGALLILCITYFWYAAALPDLGTPQEVQAALSRRVESERRGTAAGGPQAKVAKFEVLPREKLPKALIDGLLALDACPDYFAMPKEGGLSRIRRALDRLRGTLGDDFGPGRCQLSFANVISETIGVAHPIHAAIADFKVLSALSIDELLLYRLASTYYTDGVVGTRDASLRLFGKEPEALDLPEVAELLASETVFADWAVCKNPGKLKLHRDNVLDRLEAFRAIEPADAKRAKSTPVGCSTRP